MKLKLILACLLLGQFLLAQQANRTIEGRVASKADQLPVPYANIFNKALKKGTISNEQGYFRLEISGVKDSIVISFIGFKELVLPLKANQSFYEVELEESAQLLGEVVVTPRLNAYLYELVANCRKRPSSTERTAKAYYELKTFRDTTQVELVEGFYNLAIKGYDLADLQLKAGRLAMQPFGNRFFVSLESSVAIILQRLMDDAGRYPDGPLGLSKKAMKKHYSLHLDRKYLDKEGDSVYVIDFEPDKDNGLFYKGKIWINTTQVQVLKINLACEHCQRYPFRPIFPADSLVEVGLNITKTFSKTPDGMVFNHLDFTYNLAYKSRIGEQHEASYVVKTNAVLYAYDLEHQFELPMFDYEAGTFRGRDYRSILALPYNDFFWKNNDEYRMNDQRNSNQRFFQAPNSMSNLALLKPNPKLYKGFFEHPFVHWSNKRIKFREIMEDTTQTGSNTAFNADKFNLAVKIFVDINTYGDSTNILSATIFDPYESYYYLPMDKKALCFINLYFDICEVQRRKLEQDLIKARHDPRLMTSIKEKFNQDFEAKKRAYLNDVERGTKAEKVLQWNDYVKTELGIDNVAIFRPFEEKE